MTPNANDKSDNARVEGSSFGNTEPTDGRKQYQWESKYPSQANKAILLEATVLAGLFFFALLMIFLTWTGTLGKIPQLFSKEPTAAFQTYSYIIFSGLFAGVIFSSKYLYHAVARGTWHIDRRLWRFMSPLMSLGVAFIVGTLIDTNLMDDTPEQLTPSNAVFVGFLAGYFSDTAIAKMYEIANVLFGTNQTQRNTPSNQKSDEEQNNKSK